jgi:hypothetical protein
MLEPARDQALKRGDHREFLPLLDPADAPAAELAYPLTTSDLDSPERAAQLSLTTDPQPML